MTEKKKHEYIYHLNTSKKPLQSRQSDPSSRYPANVSGAVLARPSIYAEYAFPTLFPTHTPPHPASPDTTPHHTTLHTLPLHRLDHGRSLLLNHRHLIPHGEVLLIDLHTFAIH